MPNVPVNFGRRKENEKKFQNSHVSGNCAEERDNNINSIKLVPRYLKAK